MAVPSTGRPTEDSDSDDEDLDNSNGSDDYDSESDKQSDFHTYMLDNFGGSTGQNSSSWYRKSHSISKSHSSGEVNMQYRASRAMSGDSERSSFAKNRQYGAVVGRKTSHKEPMLKGVGIK